MTKSNFVFASAFSFTWMSSRLDRNLITVTTGQAVDAFDQLFRFLYLTSRAVDLRKVATEPEPEPDSRPQVASVVAPSAAVARKLHNPKYALVALTNPIPATSAGNDNPKEPKTSEMSKKKEQRRLSEDTRPLHPGLINLEKAYLIPYLPTWPEPDPTSDVIGFINIRDANKCTQVHLQRSERFEISQAIKFSSPFSKPQQPLPEVATPRLKHDEMNKPPPAQNEFNAKEVVVNTTVPGQSKSEDETSKQTSPPCSQKSVLHEDKTKSLKAENKLSSSSTTNPDASCETLDVSQDTPPQTSNKSLLSNKERASDKAETVSTTSLKSDFLTPLGKPQDILPEDVIPRQISVEHNEMPKLQLEQKELKANELVINNKDSGYNNSRDRTPEQSSQNSGLDKDKLDEKLSSNTAVNSHAIDGIPNFSSKKPSHSSPSAEKKKPVTSHETVNTTFSKSDSLTDSKVGSTNYLTRLKNSQDANKPMQVNLQHSEVFETSQAIKCSSLPSKPQETFTEVAVPRQIPVKYEEMNKLQPVQNELKPNELVIESATPEHIKYEYKEPDQKPHLGSQKSAPDKGETKVFQATDELCSDTAINLSHYTHDHSPNMPLHSSNNVSSSNKEKLSTKAETVSTKIPKSDFNESKPKGLVEATVAPSHNKTKDKALDQKLTPCSQKSVLDLDETKVCKTDEILNLNTAVNLDVGYCTPDLCPDTSPQSSNKAPSSNKGSLLNKPKTVSTTFPKSDLLKQSEPDQTRDVSRLITIQDNTKPLGDQQHNSQMFENSQAIKLSSQLSKPQESLPEKHEKLNKLHPTQNEPKAKGLVLDIAMPGHSKSNEKVLGQKTPLCSQTSVPDQHEMKVLKTVNVHSSNIAINLSAVHSIPDISPDTSPQSGNKSPLSNEILLNKSQTVLTTRPKSVSLTESEPDLTSDVRGFVNSKAGSKPTQVHKQHTEMLESSQTIKFSSLLNKLQETIPEIAGARQMTVEHEEMNKPQPFQNETKVKELDIVNAPSDHSKSKNKAPEQKSSLCSQKCVPEGNTEVLETENKLSSNAAINQDGDHNIPDLSTNTPPQSSNKDPSSSKERHLNKAKSTLATSLKSDSNESKPKDLQVDTFAPGQNQSKDRTPDQKSLSQKFIPDNDETKVLETESKLLSNTTPNPDVSPDTSDLSLDTAFQSSNTRASSNKERLLNKAETVFTTNLTSDSMTKLTSEKDTKAVETVSTVVDITHTLKSNSAQTSLLQNPPHPSTEDTQEKTLVSHADSHTEAINMQPKVFSEVTHTLQSSSGLGHTPHSTILTQSEGSSPINNFIAITTVHSSTDSIPCKSHSTSSPGLPSSILSFTTKPSLTSSASSFVLPLPPVPKPCTVQHSQMQSERTRSPDSSAVVPPLTSIVQISSVKRIEAASEVQDSSSNRGDQEVTENLNIFEDTPLQKLCVNSQEQKHEDNGGQHHGIAGELSVAGTKLKMQSVLLITDALKTTGANTQEIIPKDVDSNTLMLTDSKTCSDFVPTEQTEETLTNCELAKVPNCIQPQRYLARSHEPQIISFSKFMSQDLDVLEAADSLKSPMNDPTQSPPHMFKDSNDDKIHVFAGNALNHPDKQTQVKLRQMDKQFTHHEQTEKGTNAAEKPLYLSSPLLQATSNSPITMQESKPAAVKASTSDAFSSHSPTPDSQTTSPVPRSYTPDFQTPVSDISDGYFSPREDSTFSNTSEEFYECGDFPSTELNLDTSESTNYKVMDELISPVAANTGTSLVYFNYCPIAATEGTADQNTSSVEVDLLSRTTEVTLSSLRMNRQKCEPKEDINASDQEEDIWVRRSNTEKMNQESQEAEETDNQEAIRMMKHAQHQDDLTETVAKGNEAQTCMQKRALINSAIDNVVDRRVTGAGSTGQETESKPLSTGDVKLEEVSSKGNQPEKASLRKEEAPNQATLNLNNEEERGRQPTRETKGQKVWLTLNFLGTMHFL